MGHYENSCARKKRFPDRESASLSQGAKQEGRLLNYYACSYCDGFHVTSKPASVPDYLVPREGPQLSKRKLRHAKLLRKLAAVQAEAAKVAEQ